MKKIVAYFPSLILLILYFGCSTPEIVEETQPETINNVNELVVPDGFNYATHKTVNLNITMPNSIEFDDYRSRFTIYTKEGSENGEKLFSGSFDSNGRFSDEFIVSQTMDKLYFKSVVTDSLIPLSTSYAEREYITLNLEDLFNEDLEDSFPVSSKLNTKISYSKVNDGLVNGDFSTNDFDVINKYNKFTPGILKWSFVDKGKAKPMTWYQENGNGFIGTTDADKDHFGVVQTFSVSSGELVDFTINVKTVNDDKMESHYRVFARNANGKTLKKATLKYKNPTSEWTTKNVLLTMPSGTEYCTVEAVGKDKSRDGMIIFDNFSVSGISDTDGDGVEDGLDDYPNDASKSVNSYYPSENGYATIAYEDTWPSRGDYDFNDLVVDYQFKQELNADNKMVALEADFKFKAAGASYQNGFGFQMEVNPDLIASVTGSNLNEGYISTSANGTESGHSKATIIVTDNVFNVLPHPGGVGINTTPGNTYVEPRSVIIRIEFTEPISLEQAGYAPYNPFMIVNKDRGREVHLPGYAPTTMANSSLFGTMNDDTNLGTGKYYLTETNLPWAINLPESFDYPVEGEEILDSYVHFGQWAKSRGYSFMDWYGDKSGYRNNGKIYKR